MRLRVVALAGLAAAPAASQAPIPGNCGAGTAEGALDVSDVYARAFTTGSLFYKRGFGAAHVVPKFGLASPIYAAQLWVAGFVGSELRTAGATFSDYEFWPGPLDPATGRPPDPEDCSEYDRIWNVSTRDVEAYDDTGAATPDLAEWPVVLGAEVVDGDGVPGNYNLAGGDRPRIYGTQTLFWVMNDVGNIHVPGATPPIGIEVRVHAFSIASTLEALNTGLFYRYTVINRNSQPLEEARFGMWSDPDLGDSGDDWVGTDTTRNLGYVYNAYNSDGNGSGGTYGTPPPASGFVLLGDDVRASRWSVNGTAEEDPTNGVEVLRWLQGRWNNGVPLTAGGYGYQSGGPVTTFHFPGDPVTNSFWSMRCPEVACGPPLLGGNVRLMVATGDFTLAPGAARTFDIGLLFGIGADHIDSITELRAATDLVQQHYDAGTLFATAPPPASLPAPTGLYPGQDQYVGGGPVTLSWNAVAGAEGYVVDLWNGQAPAGRRSELVLGTSIEVPGCGALNHLVTCTWRVRADAPSVGAVGIASSETFRMQEFAAGLLDGGGSVIETANPSQAPCPDPDDFGCEAYGGEGNTVFRDPNRTGDYDISSSTGRDLGLLNTASPGGGFGRTASPFDYEIRFTETGGYAVYNAFLQASTVKQIARVPFEIWNVGMTPDDPSDDVRMIPVLRQPYSPEPPADPMVVDWENTFPRTERRVVGFDTVDVPVTEQVAALFPDRPHGYDLFEAAAIAFGGAGAIYNPAADGDTQIDLNPTTGAPCSRQGYYIGFCSRNDQTVPPGGNTAFSAAFVQLLFTDLAMDGTTPPSGTVVRLKMARYPLVANEPPAPAGGERVAIEAVWPNPADGRATIRYWVPVAGAARVVVYDVLGREVAVLADGPAPAGRRDAALAAGALAPGVYVVAVETPAGRAARTFTVLR